MNEDDEYLIYKRPSDESPATGLFVGIIVALALLAIGYLVFEANSTAPAPSVQTTQN